jgi:hypothetical protein
MPQSGWYELTDAANGFAIEFPGPPAHKQRPRSATAGATESYSFSFSEHFFYAAAERLQDPPKTAAQRASYLKDFVQRYAQDTVRNGGRLLSQTWLDNDDVELVSRELAGVEQQWPTYTRARVYLRNGRKLLILCSSWDEGGIDQALADRFFASLRLGAEVPRSNPKRPRPTAVPSAQVSMPTSWYEFTGPNNDFVVAFPYRPRREAQPNPTTGTRIEHFTFAYGDYLLGVVVTEVPVPPQNDEERAQLLA